jgi:DNA-binding MarR family transcriptional regulator
MSALLQSQPVYFMPNPKSPIVPLEERLSYRCSLISTRIARFMAPMWEDEYGLTVITWRVMAVIGRFGPLSAKEVAKYTSTDAFFVSRAIEQLVTQGFVCREADPRDRRRAFLQLTAAGKKVHRKIEAAINRLEAELTDELSEQERAAMNRALCFLELKTRELQEGEKSWKDFA